MRKTAYIILASIAIYFVGAFAVTQLDSPPTRDPVRIMTTQDSIKQLLHERDSLLQLSDSIQQRQDGIQRIFYREGKYGATLHSLCIEHGIFSAYSRFTWRNLHKSNYLYLYYSFGIFLVNVAANSPE